MYSFPTLSLFDDLVRPHRDRVFVVSDSQYQEYRKAQVEDQIKALESRAAEYRKYLETVEVSITELKQDIGLLPASEEKK